MGYNSENTLILATEMQAGNNKRMLLLHKCESGRLEYVIGSYFTTVAKLPNGEVHEDGSVIGTDGFASDSAFDAFWKRAVKEYSWDWGHYFGDVVSAVRYWEEEVIGEGSER